MLLCVLVNILVLIDIPVPLTVVQLHYAPAFVLRGEL
jgi:hypothetical protein